MTSLPTTAMTRFLLFPFLFLAPAAHAIEVTVSAPALERTLRTQLFNAPGPPVPGGAVPHDRFYLKGSASTPCYTYAEDPRVSFRHEPSGPDRVVVAVRTHSHLGTVVRGACVGLTLTADTEVSLVPVAQGESIGFRDARLDQLSANRELNFLLEPFLARRLPQQMSVDASALMRALLARAPESTGYTFSLTSLHLHSMQVAGQSLLVDLDATLRVD